MAELKKKRSTELHVICNQNPDYSKQYYDNVRTGAKLQELYITK